MKTNKIIFYAATGLLTVIMLMSASMYFFDYDNVAEMFKNFGYPTYIIKPYGLIKVLGLVALWFFRGKAINEWAYAGFFFAFVLAFFAHVMIGDNEQWGAVIAMILLALSYLFGKKVQNG